MIKFQYISKLISMTKLIIFQILNLWILQIFHIINLWRKSNDLKYKFKKTIPAIQYSIINHVRSPSCGNGRKNKNKHQNNQKLGMEISQYIWILVVKWLVNRRKYVKLSFKQEPVLEVLTVAKLHLKRAEFEIA